MISYFQIVTAFLPLISLTYQVELVELRDSHYARDLSDVQVNYLADLSNVTQLNEVLDNICIPRVVGTKNHDKVHNYIISELSDLGWHVEVDKFKDETPNFGVLTFRNIIASLNPLAQRFLVLSCHYDSKFFKDIDFEGATDSAVPCAMMLNLASVMRKELLQYKENTDLSLKFIFFDGEEAFVTWGPKDSIYGARHLAEKLGRTKLLTKSGEQITELQRIDVLILLDLIGAPNPSFYSYFPETDKWHFQLASIEQRLTKANKLNQHPKSTRDGYFKRAAMGAHIEDDHIPFLLRGVPILHLIPVPFPKEWHTPKDNRAIVDVTTVENINKILRVFVAEYLHLYPDR